MWPKGKIKTEEHKRKIAIAHAGMEASEEAKLNMSLAHKGKRYSPETEFGEGCNHPNWKGGVSSTISRRIATSKWQKIKKKVFKRDNYTCQICGRTKEETQIHSHHIIPYRISQDDSLENLISLCNRCHTTEERKYYNSKLGDQ